MKYRRDPKYHAVHVKNCPHCTFTHDSKAEAARCAYWHEQKRLGVIAHIDVHPVVTIPGGRWTLDFALYDGQGFCWFEDVKGMETEKFKMQRKEFDRFHPMSPLECVKGRSTKTKGWVWTKV